jgi:hypothetical protein
MQPFTILITFNISFTRLLITNHALHFVYVYELYFARMIIDIFKHQSMVRVSQQLPAYIHSLKMNILTLMHPVVQDDDKQIKKDDITNGNQIKYLLSNQTVLFGSDTF